jgi:MoaA/NifB/PqqE/SkfB family radical SAM enzyme
MGTFRKTNRAAYVNYLRAKYETYIGATDVRAYPFVLCVDPSDKCQLRCPTCPTGIENESRRQKDSHPLIFRSERVTLTPDLVASLLDEIGEYLFLINFYNYGEPLLNKQLPSFIRRATASDIATEVHTNLSLPLSDQFIEELLTAGLGHLQASIDGFTQETYQVHRVGGDLALVKRNLERFVEARNRLGLETEISYNFLVFSFNEHELEATRAYCRDLGINFNDRDAFVDDPSWLPSYRRQEKPWPLPEAARLKRDKVVGWSPMPSVEAGRCPPACAWHHGFSVVSASGAVAPCCAPARDRDDFGTVSAGRTRFADVWNNDLFRASRAAFSDAPVPGLEGVETICTKCPYPTFLQHLYSVHDANVMIQYAKALGGADALLDEAFDRLSRIRTGFSLQELAARGGIGSVDDLFVGHEGKDTTQDFVDFFSRAFGSAPGAIQMDPRAAVV